jgi:hypothetical protein
MPHKWTFSQVFLTPTSDDSDKGVEERLYMAGVPDEQGLVSKPYRLYKRRFVGLFGMVGSTQSILSLLPGLTKFRISSS